MFRLSYAHKLALTMTTLVMLAATLIGYPLVYRQFSMMEEKFETLGVSLAQQAAINSVELIFVGDEFNIERLVNSFKKHEFVLAVVLINKDLHPFGTVYPRPSMDQMGNPNTFISPGVLNEKNDVSWFYEPIRFNSDSGESVSGGVAWIGLDKAPLIRDQYLVITGIISALVMLVLAIIWLALRLSKSLSKPINELVEATQAIEAGQYGYRIQNSQYDEFEKVKTAFNNMADGLEQKLTLEKNISRFVSSPVAHSYMSRDESELTLQGERVEASIMFVDLVGYTSFSEQHPPETVAEVLNLYFSEFSLACHHFHGNVDKYIGDCAMLVFGCPNSDTQHREHALECALFIRNRIIELNASRRMAKLPWLDIRIGLAGGTVLAGLLGSAERLNYSVIGEAANLAARLCDKAPRGEILIDRDFYLALGPRPDLRTHETQRLAVKGFSQPVDTLVVEDISNYSEPTQV